MIKQLHLVLLSVLMAAFSVSASAQDTEKFVFNEENSYEQFGLAGFTTQDTQDAGIGDINENVTSTKGATSLTITPSTTNTKNRMWMSVSKNGDIFYSLRLYGGSIIISSDKNIASVTFEGYKIGGISASTGSIASGVWTAAESTNTVEFTFFKEGKNNTYLDDIVITFGEGSGVNPDPTPDPEPTETVAENIAAFNELGTKDGTEVTLKLTDAKVLYVNEYESKGQQKQEVFVKDASGCVMFYNAGLAVKNGDVMNGSVKGLSKDFFGTKEFCTSANTDVTAITITEGALAMAETKALNEVTESDISNLVAVNDVQLISADEADDKGNMHTNYYMVDKHGNELAFYNKFHIAGFDAQDLVGNSGLNFIGIITLHYGKIQLCPVDPANTGIDCIETIELNANAPMYNVAGQKVNANYKGIVLQNGKKFLNK